MTSDSQKFDAFLKDKSIPARKKNLLLRQYGGQFGGAGSVKKMKNKQLINHIIQGGGSWNSFTNWVSRAANTVGNTFANAGKAVYKKVLKPVGETVVKNITEKPVSTIGKVAGIAGMIPTPFAPGLKAAGAALTAVGSAVGKGKGQRGGAVRSEDGKPIMLF